jgi:5S rRNA maturation endonuclease (ribonuclease M5)
MTAKVEVVLSKLKIAFEPKAKHGRLWARCPYHEDVDPSWFIRVAPRDRYGLHHCFSCKEGGSLVDLVKHVRGLDSDAAIRWLAEIETTEDVEPLPEISRVVEKTKIDRHVFQLPKEVIIEPFDKWVTPARRYLESRGVMPWQVARHRLGYAVDGRLAGRIVIPIYHRSGRACCYHARDFCDQDRRYLFPSAEDNPDLDTLFGESRWGPWVSQRFCVVVTEGAFNALAVERATLTSRRPIMHAAIGSSDFRSAHAFKLATFERVILLTDSDLAGDRIAGKLEAALSRHTVVRRVRLEGGDANKQPEHRLREILLEARAFY